MTTVNACFDVTATVQFCEAGIVMRRFAHIDAADHSTKDIVTVGYVLEDQKFAHGTVLAAQPWPFAPHSHVGAPLCV